MKLKGNGGFALLLIGCGALILLSKLGWVVHSLFGLIFPLVLMYLGYYGIKRGRSVIGWILLGFGTLILLGKLSGLIAIAIAAAFIFYGLSLLKNKSYTETEV